MTHLIIGCGYLGLRVAKLWLDRGETVTALTRTRAAELQALGISPIVGDVLEPPATLPRASTLVYAVGLDRSSGRSFRDVYINGLRKMIAEVPAPDQFIYVSSTSVYGQTDGSWVDEESPTEPLEENGRIVLEAEQMLRASIPSAIILRFAGIYGPGRMIRRAAIEKGEPLVGDFEKLVNLIHVDDGARAVLAASSRGKPGTTYLIADGHPVRRRDFYSFMAELLQAPPARFAPEVNTTDKVNRRVSNRKMLEELGVQLEFVDYRAGLHQSMQVS